jgi:predicted glycogen debranching enzyme
LEADDAAVAASAEDRRRVMDALDLREWLEADGLGGFAMGTVAGVRSRRYHALLLAATRPPGGRMVLVNDLEGRVVTEAGAYHLAAQRYLPDVTREGVAIESFTVDPWPTWIYRLPDGTRIRKELFVARERAACRVAWSLLSGGAARLELRPFLTGRDYHALHQRNDACRAAPRVDGERLRFALYDGVPSFVIASNGRFTGEPLWYHGFLYDEERARGLDHAEDVIVPGVIDFDLTRGEARCLLATDAEAGLDDWDGVRAAELSRRRGSGRLACAADAYAIRRGGGRSLVAGYPWFTDWGRDTFIAMRGLCLALGRRDQAGAILAEWAGAVSEGMLPNRFPDRGETPELNSVDASLWYIVAVDEYLAGGEAPEAAALRQAVEQILIGYAGGARYRIGATDDGLLAAGVPGVQLTWMDAKVGDWVVTPRIGKPVEVNALWLNALDAGARLGLPSAARWRDLLLRGRAAFAARFVAPRGLYDVVDVDHRPGEVDATVRPNQILAVGGLPLCLVEGEVGRGVVDLVEVHLWTPLGLRSLAPDQAGYRPRYEGGVLARDGAYHQGTVWPWLLGPFVEAWVRVRGGGPEVKRMARQRFLGPLEAHLDEAGIGHVSEIADAEPPHTPRGCPFQAWSIGELIRLDRVVLSQPEP